MPFSLDALSAKAILDLYRMVDLPIPENYHVVAFSPPKPRDFFFSVISHTVIKTNRAFPDFEPRLILKEVEP